MQRHRHAGGAELFELRDGPAEPDLACRGVDVDEVERDKPALELAVVDYEMGDGMSAQMNDHAAHFAADPIGTADVSPDRQWRRSLPWLHSSFPGTLASPASRSAVELPGREQPHLVRHVLAHWSAVQTAARRYRYAQQVSQPDQRDRQG